MEERADVCLICDKILDGAAAIRKLQEVAIARVRSASLKRKDKKYVHLKNKVEVDVHKSCYDSYINEKKIACALKNIRLSTQPAVDEIALAAVENEAFDFANKCLFCGKAADDLYMKRIIKSGTRYKQVRFISHSKTKESILNLARKFDTADFMKVVKDRIENVDLVEVKGRYHDNCMKSFFKYEITSKVKGRPITEDTVDILDFISNYIIQNPEECQYSLRELIGKYQSNNNKENNPNIQNIKDRLLQFFGNEMKIYQTKNDYHLIFIDSVDDILGKAFENRSQKDEEKEEERIVTLAGQIILKQIRSQHYDLDNYPAPSTFLDAIDEQTPPLLRKLLNVIICSHKSQKPANMRTWNHRVTMFSHGIVASARPRSFVSPLLLGISTLLHKKHASRTLIDSLAHLGVAESYSETLRFEDSVSQHPEKLNLDGSYIQMVFDNADHNTITIDGRNTFHATGGIICVTPASSVSTNEKIERVVNKTSATSSKIGFMPVRSFFKPKNEGLNDIILEQVNTSKETFAVDITKEDFLWAYNKSVRPDKCPGWSGFMEKCAEKKPYEISKVIPVQFINAPISEYDTIYTFLYEANARCLANGQKHIFVTLDLPPFIKATEVRACVKGTLYEEHLQCVILRLGQLHICMSFQGSIGNIMAGSGIEEAFSQIYAENSVEKVLSGHAYSRAVRGHILVQNALNQIIIGLMDLTVQEIDLLNSLIEKIGTGAFSEAASTIEFQKIYNRFKTQINVLEEYGPTAQLWLQYLRMVEILKIFIEAERTGDWNLHLYAGRQMLPYLHAAGHLQYAKYLQLYLQEMIDLANKMDVFEFEKFTNLGYFTIRRTNKFRSGIASDMTIEQMLMRPMKSSGGLTHGRGMSEAVLSRWILSSISTIDVVDKMEQYCNVQYQSSDQHIDTSNSRMARDASDVKKLLLFFDNHNPFPKIDKIMSITSGIVGNDTIDCHKAFDKGFEAMNKMQGQFGAIKMERKHKVVPLKAATSSIKIDGETIAIDPTLIYQRMILNIESELDRRKYLEFELAPFPTSLFKDGLMRKNKKSSLYSEFKECSILPLVNTVYIIDGGFLLHKVVWQADRTVSNIVQYYVEYLKKIKGEKIVVFDGYSDDTSQSTKGYERLRRQNKNSCCDININYQTKVTVTQENFLSNGQNKEKLILLLSEQLQKNNIKTVIAKEDADKEIVNQAITHKQNNVNDNVIIMGEDIDLLVLLTHLADDSCLIYFLKPGKGRIKQKLYTSQSFKHKSLVPLILFIHAISGCDTTSALYNKGKVKILKKILKTASLQDLAKTFYNSEACVSDIVKDGCEIIRHVYKTKGERANLTELRYKRFEQAKIKASLQLESLPPTPASAEQHCLRVYHQVQKWLGNDKDPKQWGWTACSGILRPKFSNVALIPDDLLLQVSCKCKGGCNTKSCSCRKNGVHCDKLCKNCDGNCKNVPEVIIDEATFNTEPDNAIDAFVENLQSSNYSKDAENVESGEENDDDEEEEEEQEALDEDDSDDERDTDERLEILQSQRSRNDGEVAHDEENDDVREETSELTSNQSKRKRQGTSASSNQIKKKKKI